MISPPMSRSEVGNQLGATGKELTAAIKAMKLERRIIQRRVSAGPMTTKKKVVFNFIATNLSLPV